MFRRFLTIFIGQILIVIVLAAVATQAGGPDWIYYIVGVLTVIALVYAVRRDGRPPLG